MMRREKAAKMMDLPVEILCEIFKRLPVNSVACLRCVSKTLLEIVQSPFFVSVHIRLSILTNTAVDQPPRLTMRFVGDDWNNCLVANETPSNALETLNYDGGSNGNLVVSEILSTSDNARYSVQFSYCNLFFLTRKHDDCFLIDPFTREVLRIPTSGILYTNYGTSDIYIFPEVYGMGFDSVTSTHKILRFSQIIRRNGLDLCSVAQILELGTNSWREIPPHAHYLGSRRSLCAYGDMHWLTLDGRGGTVIISFDFTKEVFYRTPTLELPSLNWLHTNLIALRGSMAIVIVDTTCVKIDIWVMKDYHKKEWVRDYTINMHKSARFDFSFPCALSGEWENGIFFEDARGQKSFFVDLRCNSMQVIKRPVKREGSSECWRILSVNRSLLSLKNYGNLVEAKPGSQTMLDFSKNYLWQHPDRRSSKRMHFDSYLQFASLET